MSGKVLNWKIMNSQKTMCERLRDYVTKLIENSISNYMKFFPLDDAQIFHIFLPSRVENAIHALDCHNYSFIKLNFGMKKNEFNEGKFDKLNKFKSISL